MMTTAPLQMTHDVHHRSAERTASDCVLELLRTGHGADVLGRNPNQPRVQLSIVRTADSYWATPHANGTILAVYEKDAPGIDAWAWKQLHNPEQNRYRLHRLPVHHTPEQAITADRPVRAVGHGSVNAGRTLRKENAMMKRERAELYHDYSARPDQRASWPMQLHSSSRVVSLQARYTPPERPWPTGR